MRRDNEWKWGIPEVREDSTAPDRDSEVVRNLLLNLWVAVAGWLVETEGPFATGVIMGADEL